MCYTIVQLIVSLLRVCIIAGIGSSIYSKVAWCLKLRNTMNVTKTVHLFSLTFIFTMNIARSFKSLHKLHFIMLVSKDPFHLHSSIWFSLNISVQINFWSCMKWFQLFFSWIISWVINISDIGSQLLETLGSSFTGGV